MKLQELIFYLVHKRLQPETSNVMMTMSTLQALSGMPGMGGRCIYYSEVEPGWWTPRILNLAALNVTIHLQGPVYTYTNT